MTWRHGVGGKRYVKVLCVDGFVLVNGGEGGGEGKRGVGVDEMAVGAGKERGAKAYAA